VTSGPVQQVGGDKRRGALERLTAFADRWDCSVTKATVLVGNQRVSQGKAVLQMHACKFGIFKDKPLPQATLKV